MRSGARGPSTARPSSTPNHTSGTSSRFQVATPATAPAASHQRGVVRRASSTVSTTARVSGRSIVEVSSTCPRASGSPAKAAPQAANATARRSPPSSRVIRPTSTTDAALATVAGMRSAHASSATSEVNVRASHGVSGGWST